MKMSRYHIERTLILVYIATHKTNCNPLLSEYQLRKMAGNSARLFSAGLNFGVGKLEAEDATFEL